MRLFQNRNMFQSTVHLPGDHSVLVQFHHQNSHNQGFRFHRPHTADINNNILVKQFRIFQIIFRKNQSVQTCRKRPDTSTKRTGIIALAVGRILRCFYHIFNLLQNICKIGINVPFGIFRQGQIPSRRNIGALHCVLQNRRHSGIHGPADIKDFNQPVQMLQHMDIRREPERINAQDMSKLLRICPIHFHIRKLPEYIFIFPFRRFHDKERGTVKKTKLI